MGYSLSFGSEVRRFPLQRLAAGLGVLPSVPLERPLPTPSRPAGCSTSLGGEQTMGRSRVAAGRPKLSGGCGADRWSEIVLPLLRAAPLGGALDGDESAITDPHFAGTGAVLLHPVVQPARNAVRR